MVAGSCSHRWVPQLAPTPASLVTRIIYYSQLLAQSILAPGFLSAYTCALVLFLQCSFCSKSIPIWMINYASCLSQRQALSLACSAISDTRNSCLWKTMDLAAIGPDAQCWNTENFLMQHTTHDASLPALGSTIPPASSLPSKSLLPSLFPSCSCQLHPHPQVHLQKRKSQGTLRQHRSVCLAVILGPNFLSMND